jgi:hypothetical protein
MTYNYESQQTRILGKFTARPYQDNGINKQEEMLNALIDLEFVKSPYNRIDRLLRIKREYAR